MNKDIVQLSIKELLNGSVDYIIPMYQRNYAWDEGEITQLLQDIIDYIPGGQNYYIGTLVVFERPGTGKIKFETIDGQQRLTTLSLIASYLKNRKDQDFSWYEQLCMHFESREHSRLTFATIFEGKFKNDPDEILQGKDINTAILNGYRLVHKILLQRLKENNVTLNKFTDFLLDKVQIMRVKVPEDTDLNHYFEIMNSRGEQLEKHEVLKSRMMEVLNGIEDPSEQKESLNCLHAVWEACANMERYVQMGFSPEHRNAIFGDKEWGKFDVSDFNELCREIKVSGKDDSNTTVAQSLDEIIKGVRKETDKEKNKDESLERFSTVINFPNFLLHVLRVFTKQDIPLDDKRLISTFELHILKCEDSILKVKEFIFSLLKSKFLFDQYVIKREFIKESDGWSLKRLKWNDGGANSNIGRGSYVNSFSEDERDGGINRRLLMLLSAFHVSTPTLVYKHWLNAVLNHLFYSNDIRAEVYLNYLESVAKSFVFDRFLAPIEGTEYFDMIYKYNGVCQTDCQEISNDKLKIKLSFGNIENNLVFNYLDYLLWVKYQDTEEKVRAYEFTFRSSVEHYYPQNPLPGHEYLPDENLNSFGNLCLISHSKNSRLSNLMPESKKEYYQVNTIDSVKQHLMMKYEQWDTESIDEHYDAMVIVLKNSLNDEYKR